MVARMMFLLGTHHPNWLGLTDVPLFVSVSTLGKIKEEFPIARGPWGQDSSGFTMLRDHGRWIFTPQWYADRSRLHAKRVGRPTLVSIMDWMCEPIVREKTGKSVKEHQQLTIESFLTLRDLAPELPWMPVLQGWAAPDYLDHIDQYAAAGIDLRQEPIVGVGSVCRRQGKIQTARIITAIATEGIRIHAFGVKTDGLALFGDHVVSSDSMAWSYAARKRPILLDECKIPRPGRKGHQNCANCFTWAMKWRNEVLSSYQARRSSAPQQLELQWSMCA